MYGVRPFRPLWPDVDNVAKSGHWASSFFLGGCKVVYIDNSALHVKDFEGCFLVLNLQGV